MCMDLVASHLSKHKALDPTCLLGAPSGFLHTSSGTKAQSPHVVLGSTYSALITIQNDICPSAGYHTLTPLECKVQEAGPLSVY